MTADEVLNQVADVPVISETARKLTMLLGKPNTHRDELVKTIRGDNVLTAKILRLCNSAEVGIKHPVASLDQAIFLVGDAAIFRMVSTISFGGDLMRAMPGYAVEANGLWSHSLTVGLGSEYIGASGVCGDFQPSLAFTAGLLHDLGKLMLNQLLTPKNRADIRSKMTNGGLSRVEAERGVMGADHAEVGACLLRKWLLPEILIEAVGHHHAPVVKPTTHLSAVIYLANHAAHLNSAAGPDPKIESANKSAAELLGIRVEGIDHTIADIQGAMRGIRQYLAIA